MVRSRIRRLPVLAFALALLCIWVGGTCAAAVQTPSCSTALLVIDVQHIWLGRGIMLTTDGRVITDKIAEILPLARQAGVLVVFVKDVSERGNVPEYRLDMPVAIAPLEGDLVSEKRVGDAFSYTGLHATLQDRGVTRVLISGLASHSCVEATVWGARIRSYDIVILEDGHTGGQGGRIAREQNALWEGQDLEVISSAELDWSALCSVAASEEPADHP